jgi:hypothetical protein
MMATTRSQAQSGQAVVKDAGSRVSAHMENDAPGIDPAVCSNVSMNTHIQWAGWLVKPCLRCFPDEVVAAQSFKQKTTIGWDS